MKRHQIPQANSSRAAGSSFVSLNFFYSLVQIVFFWVTDRILHHVQSMVMKFLSQIHQKVNTLEKQSYVISLERIWEARTFLGVGPNGTPSTMYEYVSKVYWKDGTSTKECARIIVLYPNCSGRHNYPGTYVDVEWDGMATGHDLCPSLHKAHPPFILNLSCRCSCLILCRESPVMNT